MEKSKGLGDTVAKVIKAVGLDKVKKDCDECEKRKKAWNERFPYNKAK